MIGSVVSSSSVDGSGGTEWSHSFLVAATRSVDLSSIPEIFTPNTLDALR
jgi:hypothetical protein